MKGGRRPKLAVWKFASCGGCQLSALNFEETFSELAEAYQIAMFLEYSSAHQRGPFDVSLVEGSISNEEDVKRIQKIRKQSRVLVAIGACATSGGIQALRNLSPLGHFARAVYPNPAWLSNLAHCSPIDHYVEVDYELRGCPVSRHQLIEVLSAISVGRKPAIPTYPVCQECKRKGVPCLVVTSGVACMGPVTRAGCGAICPSFGRGCFGCFGPSENPKTAALTQVLAAKGVPESVQARLYSGITGQSAPFAEASEALEE